MLLSLVLLGSLNLSNHFNETTFAPCIDDENIGVLCWVNVVWWYDKLLPEWRYEKDWRNLKEDVCPSELSEDVLIVVLFKRILLVGTFSNNVNVLLMGTRNLGYLKIAVLTLFQDNIFCPVQCVDKQTFHF